VIVLAGRLGRAAAPALRAALQDAIRDANQPVVLDLQGVDYVSSSGIEVLDEAVSHVRARNLAVAFSGLTEAVRLTLELAGTLQKVPAEPTRPDAVRHLQSRQ
jgi:anti-anti-sigma factor